MKSKHVALLGKSRSGKDTVAGFLAKHAGYTRLAFADRLKGAALRTNPWITYETNADWDDSLSAVRLADLVQRLGWERAKDQFPEVRRLLQEYGQTVREMDPRFWIRPVATQLMNGTVWNMPAVVTDVRYRNEVDTLRELGAVVVRVIRPGAGLSGEAANHSSETELDDLEPDVVLGNAGDLDDLYAGVRALYDEHLTGAA